MPRAADSHSIVEQYLDAAAGQISREALGFGQAWEKRILWQVQLRWWVSLVIVIGALVAREAGFAFEIAPILVAAVAILLYNCVFAFVLTPLVRRSGGRIWYEQVHAFLQIVFDFAAIFCLMHYTGGSSSPLLFFLIFHVIFTAILFRPAWAYVCAGIATLGMFALAIAHSSGALAHHSLGYGNHTVTPLEGPAEFGVRLGFFGAVVFLTALSTSWIVSVLRRNVLLLTEAAEHISTLVKERSRFMFYVAHNMRAPLTAAQSLLSALREGFLGPMNPQQEEYLQRVDQRLHGMNRTLGALLTVARGRLGELKPKQDRVDIVGIGHEVERIFVDHARTKQVALEFIAPAAGLQVVGDAEMLKEMLENLVSNALKYTPAGGRVTVTLTALGDAGVRLEVRDTGIGIPEADQSRIFDDFFRASNAKKLEGAGTGLGLAIVKQSVEHHGGQIDFTSREGEGTTFSITLPAAVR